MEFGKAGSIHQFCGRGRYGIRRERRCAAHLETHRRASNPNLYTIGIEHEGQPQDIWPDEQYAASASLVREIASSCTVKSGRPRPARIGQYRPADPGGVRNLAYFSFSFSFPFGFCSGFGFSAGGLAAGFSADLAAGAGWAGGGLYDSAGFSAGLLAGGGLYDSAGFSAGLLAGAG